MCENNKNTNKNMKDNSFFHFMRTSPLRNWPLYHRLRFAMKEKRMRKSVTRRGEDFDKLRPLLLESMVKYHWDTDEFFIYHYADLTPEQRHSFVPEYEKNIFCDKVNDYKSSKRANGNHTKPSKTSMAGIVVSYPSHFLMGRMRI